MDWAEGPVEGSCEHCNEPSDSIFWKLFINFATEAQEGVRSITSLLSLLQYGGWKAEEQAQNTRGFTGQRPLSTSLNSEQLMPVLKLYEYMEPTSRVDLGRGTWRVLDLPQPSDRTISCRVRWDSKLRIAALPNASTKSAVNLSTAGELRRLPWSSDSPSGTQHRVLFAGEGQLQICSQSANNEK